MRSRLHTLKGAAASVLPSGRSCMPASLVCNRETAGDPGLGNSGESGNTILGAFTESHGKLPLKSKGQFLNS